MADTNSEDSITEPTVPIDLTDGSGLEDIPKKIGPYMVECLLKKSGMSIIYLCSHLVTKQPTIIKILLPKYLKHVDVINRFLREAEIIALADHPNIVKMYEHGPWEGGHYIAMEFISGISLRQYILQHPMSLKRSLEMLLEIAYAICHLHAHGVIHRDLKPENILVSDTGQIKMIDFGIAQLLTDTNVPSHQSSRSTIGTPIYMSPEQRKDPESVSYPSDIYSMGIIAYELILGRLSHGQVHLSLMPKGLQKIFIRALQPDPEERYQDIVDIISDISFYMASETMQKEKKASDTLYDLSESLRRAQQFLLPSTNTDCQKINVGIAYHTGIGPSGLFGEMMNLGNDRYAIVLGKPLTDDVDGILHAAMLKGIIHSMDKENITAKNLANTLDKHLNKEANPEPFALCCLVLDHLQNRLHYISCSFGTLWNFQEKLNSPHEIVTYNSPIGSHSKAELTEVSSSWNKGDHLLIFGFSDEKQIEKEKLESLILHGLIEYLEMPPQKQVDGLMRKIRLFHPSQANNCIIIKIERSNLE
jgi:serine/threonine protein kinase